MKNDLILFEDYKIRRLYNQETETWYFSVVDIMQVLTQQPDFQKARNYWKVLKTRLKKEGNQSVTNCNRLKLEAADGKKYFTDVANPATNLRTIGRNMKSIKPKSLQFLQVSFIKNGRT